MISVNGLVVNCAVSFTIIAGETLNGTLQGPRSAHGNITVPDCPVMTTTVTSKDNMTCRLKLLVTTKQLKKIHIPVLLLSTHW